MKKKLSIFIFVFSFINLVFCQDDILQLHKLVGDTIDLTEKKDYYLFIKIPDSIYDYCFIKQAESQFVLVTHFLADSVNERVVDSIELKEYILNIEKLSAYYEYQESSKESDSLYINESTNPSEYNIQILNSNLKKEISSEADQNRRLQDDKTRQTMREQGFYQPESHIEFFSSKKKKKKK